MGKVVIKVGNTGKFVLKRSHFFETLKSERRLRLCRGVSLSLYEKTRTNNRRANPFDRFSVLDEYDIYAGDGHYHAAAVHDIKKAGKKYPTQHFYSVDLRTHALRHLTLRDKNIS